MKRKENLGWHFCAIKDGKPVLRDGRPLVMRRWLRHEGRVIICESGLHLSKRAIDALAYAPGLYVTRVKYDEVVAEQCDKLVCRARMPLWGYDCTQVVLDWTRRVASDVLDFWDAPQVVKDFLSTGENAAQAATYARRALSSAQAEVRAANATAADFWSDRRAQALAVADAARRAYRAAQTVMAAALAATHHALDFVRYTSSVASTAASAAKTFDIAFAEYNYWLEQALLDARPEKRA